MLRPQSRTSNHVSSFFLSAARCPAACRPISLRFTSLQSDYRQRELRGRIRCVSNMTSVPLATGTEDIVTTLKAVITVKLTVGGSLANLSITRALDGFTGMLGKSLLLELASSELDPTTGLEKETVKAYVKKVNQEGDKVRYEGSFEIPKDFGEIGAVFVTNEQHKEILLEDIVLSTSDSVLTINCNSWVHAKSSSPARRVFFSKTCLPCKTPSGLQRLRKKELVNLRGYGRGERKPFERIYDYEMYNDRGNPDQSESTARPVLGGEERPYPRRCRTGRPPTKKDPLSETRSSDVYVPRDEALSEVKQATISAKTLNSALDAVVPALGTTIFNMMLKFPNIPGSDPSSNENITSLSLQSPFSKLMKAIAHGCQRTKHDPRTRDKLAWCRDEEFSRLTLAGHNPFSIQLVTEFPWKSKLDPEVYGPPDSVITEELIEQEIGVLSAKEALEQKRLFILDYHDLLLPFVHKVRELEGTTLYGSRTLFFLTQDGTLRPIAIELTRPASPTMPQWKRAFTPICDATGAWLWKLAKAHVCAHDSGYHQLVIHWLRCHCCSEPYIIAANRQLSAMHPIYKLLQPHFRYTLEINAIARKNLINAGGLIESCYSPGKYCMELSSAAYDQLWRFDMEALPADLIRRGMAVEDPTAEHGLRLVIKDYPFANDGLLVWSAIKDWVKDYVLHYYPSESQVIEDSELQAWWTEVRTKGHADKKDEPWWPVLNTAAGLIDVLTTIIWVASGQHAAVNFGQYDLAGNIPNRPTIARTRMPVEESVREDDEAFARFWAAPENALQECLPSGVQAARVMAWLDVLSSHASDEEYLGGEPETNWAEEDRVISVAHARFNRRLKEIEGIIDRRNADRELKNRSGAGIIPYELMKPFSKPGVTGMGIPNSISI